MKPLNPRIAFTIVAGLASFLLANGQSQTSVSSRPPGGSAGGSSGSGGGGGGYSSGGERGSVVRVIRDPAVQQEVGVSSEQKQRIDTILQRVQVLENELFQSLDRLSAEQHQALGARRQDTAAQYDAANQQLAQASSKILEQLTPAQRTQLRALCQQAKADPAGFQARVTHGQHDGGGGGGGSSSSSSGGSGPGPSTSVQREYQDGGGPGGVISVISHEQVQQQLRLDQKQRQQVAEIIGQVRQSEAAFHRNTRTPFAGPRSEGFQARQKRFEEQRQKEESVRQAVNRAGDDILKELTATQQERVRGICLQAQGADALFKPEIIQALGLTATQQVKLANLRRTAPAQSSRASQPGTNWIAAQARLQLETEKRMINEVLTPAQQAKLQQMRGKEFAGAAGFMPTAGGGWNSSAGSSSGGNPR